MLNKVRGLLLKSVKKLRGSQDSNGALLTHSTDFFSTDENYSTPLVYRFLFVIMYSITLALTFQNPV